MGSWSKPEAGASSLFPAVAQPRDLEEVVAEVEEIIHHAPAIYGLERSRWWLAGLQQVLPRGQSLTLAGLCQILERLDIHYKGGRCWVHSPDLDYDCKLARVREAQRQAALHPERVVLLYEDELTYYRCPTVAADYELAGRDGPRAKHGPGFNSYRRIAGCLDTYSGRLLCWQRSHFEHQTFLAYLLEVEACSPDVEHIYIALDNWPVHFHPDVLSGLAGSNITLLSLPTYACLSQSRRKGLAQAQARTVASASAARAVVGLTRAGGGVARPVSHAFTSLAKVTSASCRPCWPLQPYPT
jgi:hypothetical protein